MSDAIDWKARALALEGALRPFAEFAPRYEHRTMHVLGWQRSDGAMVYVTPEDFRRARTALEPGPLARSEGEGDSPAQSQPCGAREPISRAATSAEPSAPTTVEMMEALGDLYTLEFGDWELRVHHTLTEPTCPTATISPEDDDAARDLAMSFRADAETIEGAVSAVVRSAYETLIARRPFEPLVPWSNRGDATGPQRMWAAMDAAAKLWAKQAREGAYGAGRQDDESTMLVMRRRATAPEPPTPEPATEDANHPMKPHGEGR